MSPHEHRDQEFRPARVAVLTVSDTRNLSDDHSGQLIVDRLTAGGHQVAHRQWVRDEVAAIRAQVKDYLDGDNLEAVICTGGTGFAARDVTPEAVCPLFEKHIPGFGEVFRMLSYQEIGSSTIQSRADAGLAGRTLIFLLPGSTGACRLGMDELVLPQLDNRHRPCNFRDIIGR